MRLVKLFRPMLLWFALAGLGLGAGCSSNTTKQVQAFADKICACKDAACASSVQAEYLAWWQENQRARGSSGDREDIEKAMQRYSGRAQRLGEGVYLIRSEDFPHLAGAEKTSHLPEPKAMLARMAMRL